MSSVIIGFDSIEIEEYMEFFEGQYIECYTITSQSYGERCEKEKVCICTIIMQYQVTPDLYHSVILNNAFSGSSFVLYL